MVKPFHFYYFQQATYFIRVLVDAALSWDLLFIIYDPATTDLFFIRVIIYPGPGVGGLQLIS